MKKSLVYGSFAGFALAALSLSSCATTKVPEQQEKTSNTQTITLTGNPTTGYTWTYSQNEDGLFSINENIVYKGKDGVTGAPSDFIYTITGLKPGIAKLTFEYKRAWGTEEAKYKRFYIVTVYDDLSVKIEIDPDSIPEK